MLIPSDLESPKLLGRQYIWSQLLISLILCTVNPLCAQVKSPFTPIITQMEDLEGGRDAKCHATAARLEDFIYGTPLNFAARNARIDFQPFGFTLWNFYRQTAISSIIKKFLQVPYW